MAEAGKMLVWAVPATRSLEPSLRRGRLLAARSYKLGTVPRRAILGGYWDGGSIVRRHMVGHA